MARGKWLHHQTDEEVKEYRRKKQAEWRAKNREKAREYIREYMKKYRATERGGAILKAAQNAYGLRKRGQRPQIVKTLSEQLELDLTS